MTIPMQFKEDLYRFIWKIITDNNSKLLRIGGIQNHIHILLDLHPSVALASLVREIKAKSSGWLAIDQRFHDFRGWSNGYYASSISPEVRRNVIEYIMNQESHHKVKSFDEELSGLHVAAGLTYDDRDMR